MIQTIEHILSLGFTSPADVAVGDVVRITDDLTVGALVADADPDYVGSVIVHNGSDLFCTVATRFRERRDDREAAAAIDVGAFVWDADAKAVAYTAAGIAAVTGTATETFNIADGVSDAFVVKIAAGSNQTFDLTAGAARTAAQVAADINATATDFVATAVAGKVKLTASNAGEDLEIVAVANDAYTVLGFTAGVIDVSVSSHDPASVAGLIIKGTQPLVVTGTVKGPFAIVLDTNDTIALNVAGGATQTFTLTAGTAQTAEDIAADINATATDLTASASGRKLVLTADADGEDIEIETVATDAYDTVGLTVGTYAAPMTIETLEK